MTYQLPPATNPRRQFEFEIKHLADSLSFGGDPSRFLGSGLEYAQSRPYEPGDPVKLIDWRVTARTGKPFVKEYEAARQMPIYLAVDTSASMCVGSVEQSKYYWAVRLAAGIGLAGLERMSPVGVLAGGERDLRITPTLSSQTLMQWAEELRQYDFRERTVLSPKLAHAGGLAQVAVDRLRAERSARSRCAGRPGTFGDESRAGRALAARSGRSAVAARRASFGPAKRRPAAPSVLHGRIDAGHVRADSRVAGAKRHRVSASADRRAGRCRACGIF